MKRLLQHYGKLTKWSLRHVEGQDLLSLQSELLRCLVMQDLKNCEAGFCDVLEN